VEKLKLGTRRSLLAWAQSSWVAREIERLNPGTKVELIGIDTRGDKILDVSLRNVQGKEFFVAELDEALSGGSVDLTVHSMKDLSLERPAQFTLAAIPRRENPRDVVLFGPYVIDKLRAGKTLKIGTSSPRRLENIPGFLAQALPRIGGKSPSVDFVEIRGNVNTRLGRVLEEISSERALDGVVLAFAGLIRLWADDKGRAELTKLLKGVRWMVLPLRENPTAPAQGALAVECRASDTRVRGLLAKLHHEESAELVKQERQLLADWGGGCHQRFGATAIKCRDLGQVMFIRGRKPSTPACPEGEFVEETRWAVPSALPGPVKAGEIWDGIELRSKGLSGKVPEISQIGGGALFIAHGRALPEGRTLADGTRVWTSGVPSWFKLAERGIWVEGCAAGFGFEFIKPTIEEPVLGLAPFGAQWTVLTHDQAAEGWGDAKVVATYQVPRADDVKASAALTQARHVYWGSGSQFDQYGKFASKAARHYCGPGKSASYLRAKGIEPTIFPSAKEWRAWLKIR
jgi:hydroxymethylbilane synthase